MTARLKGLKVLVVEDEFLVATLIEDMLVSAAASSRDYSREWPMHWRQLITTPMTRRFST